MPTTAAFSVFARSIAAAMALFDKSDPSVGTRMRLNMKPPMNLNSG